MRTKCTFNTDWQFTKPGAAPVAVTLPHTWNAADGTDGGNDYFRGTCTYTKEFAAPAHADDEEVWLEFEGAAMTAVVTLNDQQLTRHAGGYSTFRVNLTPALAAQNTLTVTVDNSVNRTVYPQKADFTFYGGIYRDVHILIVPHSHFALDNHGAPALRVTPEMSDDLHSAAVTVEAACENTLDGTEVLFAIEGVGEQTAAVQGGKAVTVFHIENVHLWNGVADPYLYSVTASLPDGDAVAVNFGCRKIAFKPDTGFWLNGRNVRLVGAARHQDRAGLGNALTAAEHEEDIQLLRDMGANTVRLAHYQHAQYFYDLCDKYGLVAWAEIPYITEHMPEATANTLSQMEELVTQNYNHPSIICWGLSNEITVTTGVTENLTANHRLLNDLCHRLDATRPTTMAHAFMLDPNDPFVQLPDICSYNLYYGWYLGELQQNDEFFDTFHKNHPDRVIGLSEFGADANPAYQSARPERGDWSESYQAVYHEHMLKMWSERPYIWAMHVWNGFDFGADGRGEGGKPGQNQKGLVTFDRKTKKDAYFIYKAYLSSDPFVHLCGRRYAHRTESETEIKVYSNQPRVTLFVDGKEFAAQDGDRVFKFTVPISGTHEIKAVAGGCTDCMTITKADKPDPTYRAEGQVENWFDKPEELMKEGYYSIMDSMETLQKSPAANKLLSSLMVKASNAYGDVAKNVKMPPEMERQMARTSLRSILKQVAKSITPADVQQLNAALNKIKKTSNLFVICSRPFSIQIVVLCDPLEYTFRGEKRVRRTLPIW